MSSFTHEIAPERERVLVVEDEPDLGALLEYVLGQEGFSVAVAPTGAEALEALESQSPELVVLDLMPPDMDGLEILRKIRAASPSNATQVIILSARKDEQDRTAGFELGADDYVVKPFSPRELILRIRTALRRRDGETRDPSKMTRRARSRSTSSSTRSMWRASPVSI